VTVHLELLVEDASGKALLEILVPKILGEQNAPHTWRIISYKGVGRLPRNLRPGTDPSRRILLDQLPRILAGYGKCPGIDAVVVVIDADRQNCAALLAELQAMLSTLNPAPNTLFRLAIEEIEAWYFGDQSAVQAAYPLARKAVFAEYQQDGVCGTWEKLADALYAGGAQAVRNAGWPLPGELKHEWARRIGRCMDVSRNQSPSFGKFRSGLLRLAAQGASRGPTTP
jgi:hypothetical protein